MKAYKETQDNWCGNYETKGASPINLVCVHYRGNINPPSQPPYYRVNVQGTDDFGMEFDSKFENIVYQKFIEVIGMRYVDQNALKELGFDYI